MVVEARSLEGGVDGASGSVAMGNFVVGDGGERDAIRLR
jgi:hypothetical protein